MPVARPVEASQEAKAKAPAPAAVAKQAPFNIADLNLNDSNIKDFIMNPCPKRAGTIQCYIKRNKSGLSKLFPEYSVYLKDGDKFLMTSKKRGNNKTSNYLISMARGDHNR